jgi:uncharacterized delta-60 repeat protein
MRSAILFVLAASATSYAGTPGTTTAGFADAVTRHTSVHTWGTSPKYVTVGTYGFADFIGLARFDSAGVLDPTFGTNGQTTLTVGNWSTAMASDTANGTIVTAGEFNNSSTGCDQPLLTRWNGDGTRDSTFGSNGIVRASFGGCVSNFDGYLTDVKINSSSQILVLGASAASHGVVARYTWSGTLDTSFASGGIADVAGLVGLAGNTTVAFTSLRLWNGKIIVAGYFQTSGQHYQQILVRLTGSGALDTTFNGTGYVTPLQAIAGADELATWALPLTGSGIMTAGESDGEIVLRRFNSDGTADTTFGTQGVVLISTTAGDYLSNPIVDTASQGRYVVAATYNAPQGSQVDKEFWTTRILSNGNTDVTFGTAGVHRVTFFTNTPHEDILYDMLVDSTDRTILSGDADGECGVARLTASGFNDTTF